MVPLPPSLAQDPLFERAEQVMQEAREIMEEVCRTLRLRRKGEGVAERTPFQKDLASPNPS
jgi:hypothetical protein